MITEKSFIESALGDVSVDDPRFVDLLSRMYSYGMGDDLNKLRAYDLMQRHVKTGLPVQKLMLDGEVENGIQDIYEKILEMGLTVTRVNRNKKGKISYIFLNHEGTYLDISDHGGEEIGVVVYSVGDPKKDILDLVEPIQKASETGYIHVLITRGKRFDIQRAGKVGQDLERGNYSKKTREAYDRLVEDLSSPTPRGRLTILKGPPGTGKTYMVRGLVQSVEKAKFVLLPAEMISSLDGPTFLPVLLNEREEHEEGPIVLVLEDADDALVSRNGSNMSSVRALLNLTDGLLGMSLDLRILCTTNALQDDLDHALVRSGRLTEMIEIDKLSHDEAGQVLERLGGSALCLPVGPKTLAEVYARAGDWDKGEKLKEKKVGF